MNAMAFVGMSAAGRTLSGDERKAVVEAITHDSEPVLQPYSDASGLAFELTTNFATARGKPTKIATSARPTIRRRRP
jgi:hypothetical protein